MLENLPIISREAVDSISEHGLEPPTPEELKQVLNQVRERNPLLIKALVNAGVDNTLELYLKPLYEHSPQAYDALRHYLIWSMLMVLDLIDRAIFTAKLAGQIGATGKEV